MTSRSTRVWSLWDMLQEVNPEGVVKAISLLSSGAKRFQMIYHNAAKNGWPTVKLEVAEFGLGAGACDILAASAENLQMVGVGRTIARVKGWFEEYYPVRDQMPLDLLHQIAGGMEQIVVGFGDEMDGRKFFTMTPKFANLYEPDKPLFGEKVEAAFPSSSPEIAEAGKCMALGRWTAAVMHLMRALEPALRALQDAADVEVPKEQWDQILNQVEAKIKTIRKRSHGKKDEQWFSEAAAHFRFLKDAWRNYANHLHERYDEERAEEIFNSVKGFMRHLATRLYEPDSIAETMS